MKPFGTTTMDKRTYAMTNEVRRLMRWCNFQRKGVGVLHPSSGGGAAKHTGCGSNSGALIVVPLLLYSALAF
jgi:hypothetical protein